MPTLKDGTRPRIFLLDDPAREKAHASRYVKDPVALAECATLIEIIYPVVLERALSDQAIDAIVHVLQSRFKYVWEKAGGYLITLSHYFPKALEKALCLSKSENTNVRLRIIQSQWTTTLPEPHLTELLHAALTDQSTEVRRFGAIRCGDFRRQDLLPALKKQLAIEPSTKVKRSIEFAITTINAPLI